MRQYLYRIENESPSFLLVCINNIVLELWIEGKYLCAMARAILRLIPTFLLFNLVMSLTASELAVVQCNISHSPTQIATGDQLGSLPLFHSVFVDFEELADDYLESHSIPSEAILEKPSSQLGFIFCSRFAFERPPLYLLYSAWRSFLLV